MKERKVKRIPRKNKGCHGCELYTLYGVRSCKAIKGKHYIEFKSKCPCCYCLIRPMCRSKSTNATRELLGASFVYLYRVCSIFDNVRERFIVSKPGYYTEGSYKAGDLHTRELHYMMKKSWAELINFDA